MVRRWAGGWVVRQSNFSEREPASKILAWALAARQSNFSERELASKILAWQEVIELPAQRPARAITV